MAAPTAALSSVSGDGFGSNPVGRYGEEIWTLTFNSSIVGDTVAITSKFGKKIVEVESGMFTYAIANGVATLTLRVAVASGKAAVRVFTEMSR